MRAFFIIPLALMFVFESNSGSISLLLAQIWLTDGFGLYIFFFLGMALGELRLHWIPMVEIDLDKFLACVGVLSVGGWWVVCSSNPESYDRNH